MVMFGLPEDTEEAVQELKSEEFAELYSDSEEGNGILVRPITCAKRTLKVIWSLICFRRLIFPAIRNGYRLPRIRQYGRRARHTGVCRPAERSFREDSSRRQELIRIVRLRRMAKHLGMEKVVLKGQMSLFLVANPESPYYQSEAFDRLLHCSNIPGQPA